MTDQTQDLQAQLAALQAQMAALRPVTPTPAASPWASAPTPATPPIVGVSVPIKVQTPAGSIRVYLSLPPECAATPDALNAALDALAALGLPLDVYAPRDNNGSGSGWGNRSTGYNNARNNWRR